MPDMTSALRRAMLAAIVGLGVAAGDVRAHDLESVELVIQDDTDPFFAKIARSVQEYGSLLTAGKARVTISSTGRDTHREAALIDEAVRRRPDVLIVTPVQSRDVASAIRGARRAGVPVIAVDAYVDGVDVAITTDNVAAGRMACDFLARRIGGSGEVAIIDGPRVSAVAGRIQGCRAALRKFPHVHVLPPSVNGQGQRAGGTSAMSELLATAARIDGIFAIDDPTAFGAQDAIVAARRGRIPIASVDGSPDAEAQLRDTASLIEISVARLPDRMAAQALYEAIRLASGAPASHRPLLIAPQPVTRSNVAVYHGWLW